MTHVKISRVRARCREFEYDDYRILTRLLRDGRLAAMPLKCHA